MSHFSHPAEVRSIVEARHGNPFAFLGMHPIGDGAGVIVRTFHPGARRLWVVEEDGGADARAHEATLIDPDGFFERVFEDGRGRFRYRIRSEQADGVVFEHADPYAFANLVPDEAIYYFREGTNRRLYDELGAHPATLDGHAGWRFAVWAPNAQRVSVVGDFNGWDGRIHPMRKRIEAGIWEIFLPDLGAGQHYKFEVLGDDGSLVLKCDPFAFYGQHSGQHSSITWDRGGYAWSDAEWMERRSASDPCREPLSIYEVHLGSWARIPDEGNRMLSYDELADRLLDYVVDMGFTHIELMPVTEFPFDGSWGYQVTGYFAPTSRHGDPDGFRRFVDRCHQRGIGVLLDWVPAHFPKDAHGLARFDGTALYEHADVRQGEHRDWGTLIFNFGRTEVRNFLIASALFWLREYHVDGLRVDAVASMLYLDYSRQEGDWVPNRYGGRENLEAIDFLRSLNEACYAEAPGIMMIAEESTAWGGVSRPTSVGGLGFGFKWNMGWMHDFLEFMAKEPVHRRFHHGEATFSMLYAYDENFILVLSHDEVVHGKRSLIDKMPGDFWQKFANLRMFLAWMTAHPGKKLLFQGGEIAQWREWDYKSSVDWHLLQFKEHGGLQAAVRDLNRLYRQERALHECDHEPEGFEWIEHSDSDNSVFAFLRFSRGRDEVIVTAINATPVVRQAYRLGVPHPGSYREIFNSDAEAYAGSNIGNGGRVVTECVHHHGRNQSIAITLPPLATVFFKWEAPPARMAAEAPAKPNHH